MLHIILLILKMIGVILLTILGLLLASLLVVLLVPVRYRLRASHGEALYLKGRVSWLLHLVQVNVTHINGVLHIRARIFGFIIYDNLRPPKPKKKKAKRGQPKETNRIKSIKKEDEAKKAEDNNSEDTYTGHSNTEYNSTQLSNTEHSNTENSNTENRNTENSNTEDRNTENSNTKNSNTKNRNTEYNKTEYNKTEIMNTKNCKTDTSLAENGITENNSIENNEIEMNEAGENKEEKGPSGSGEKQSVFSKLYHKLKDVPERWKAAYRKVRNSLQTIRDSIRNKFKKLRDIITGIRHKWNLIYDFWLDELNKQGMKYTWHIIKRLIKHILPTKLKSELIIGTGDPYSTGQVLSVISFFYGFYGDKVSVIPDFENSRFEGKHYARGRIRAVTILIIACRLLIDKRFKYLKKNFLILKEAL